MNTNNFFNQFTIDLTAFNYENKNKIQERKQIIQKRKIINDSPNESESENQAWIDEEEEQSDIAEALGELDINNEIGEDETGDERRQMLFHFLKEYNTIIV